jgi:reactive intermediate/imine deaminase
MKKRALLPSSFTPTMGAYSHGLAVDLGTFEMVFVTGQIAIDPSGNVVSQDIEEQTDYVFKNIEKILESGNATMKDVVKAQIFLTDIADFAKVSPIRNRYFSESMPVSTMVEVAQLVRSGCKIEVEVIAIVQK